MPENINGHGPTDSYIKLLSCYWLISQPPISNMRRTKFQNLNDSRLVLQSIIFAQSIEARC